jgi:hypothetical protein
MTLLSKSARRAAVLVEARKLVGVREFGAQRLINVAAGKRGAALSAALQRVTHRKALTAQGVGVWLKANLGECLGLTLGAEHSAHGKAWVYRIEAPGDSDKAARKEAAVLQARRAYEATLDLALNKKSPRPLPEILRENVSRADVKAALLKYSEAHGNDAARALLQRVGTVNALHLLRPEVFQAVIDACALPPPAPPVGEAIAEQSRQEALAVAVRSGRDVPTRDATAPPTLGERIAAERAAVAARNSSVRAQELRRLIELHHLTNATVDALLVIDRIRTTRGQGLWEPGMSTRPEDFAPGAIPNPFATPRGPLRMPPWNVF